MRVLSFASLLACSFLISPALAQDAPSPVASDSAAPSVQYEPPVSPLNSATSPSTPQTSPDSADTAPAQDDGDGVFSFLNFSFLKKDPELVKEAETQHETFLQVVTRKANEGNVDAQLSLGYMYLYGDKDAGVEVDYQKSFEYYQLAANQGDNVAINNLGSLYYSGIGTKRNPAKAAELFTQASEQGNVEAAVNLAFLYISGSGVEKDSNKAMNYFIKAANQGNLTAEYMLGYAYYRGFIVPQNYKKAFELIRNPANAGYDEAQLVLAQMYLYGEGITKNYGNAVKYLGRSFMQGNVEAITLLADILATGNVYPKNIYQAHVLYNIASVRGAEHAAANRDALEKAMKINEILQAQAEAEAFQTKPQDLTTYIRKTFGNNIKAYIDDQLPVQPKKNLTTQTPAAQPTPVYVAPQQPQPSPTPSAPRLL